MSEHASNPETYDDAIAEGFSPIEDFAQFLSEKLGMTEAEFDERQSRNFAATTLCDCSKTNDACRCADYCSPNGVRIIRYCGDHGQCNGKAVYGKCTPYG